MSTQDNLLNMLQKAEGDIKEIVVDLLRGLQNSMGQFEGVKVPGLYYAYLDEESEVIVISTTPPPEGRAGLFMYVKEIGKA